MNQFEHVIIAYILAAISWHAFLKYFLVFEKEVQFWKEFIKKYF